MGTAIRIMSYSREAPIKPIKMLLITKVFFSRVSKKDKRKQIPVKRKNRLGAWLFPYMDMLRKMGVTEKMTALKKAGKRPNNFSAMTYKAGMHKALETTLMRLTAMTGSFWENILETKMKKALRRTATG